MLYHFYCLLEYYYRYIEKSEEKLIIFNLYEYTVKNISYSNLKNFLKKLKRVNIY
jgi:hypothetical protein